MKFFRIERRRLVGKLEDNRWQYLKPHYVMASNAAEVWDEINKISKQDVATTAFTVSEIEIVNHLDMRRLIKWDQD